MIFSHLLTEDFQTQVVHQMAIRDCLSRTVVLVYVVAFKGSGLLQLRLRAEAVHPMCIVDGCYGI
jgi:hypothetical protein